MFRLTYQDLPLPDWKPCNPFKRRHNSAVVKRQELDHALEVYNKNTLTPEQAQIYDWVLAHLNDITLVQAGPGCGKTHTMLTIAYQSPIPVYTVIYKNDLLYGYELSCITLSTAKLAMKIWNLSFYQYVAIESQLNGRLSSDEFMAVIISLVKKANMNDFKESLIIFDEYTVMAKPLLYVLLLLFHMYNIGCVICGDKNQLQNIHNSKHTGISSYDIANSFASKCFQLTNNIRCSNLEYNALIDYIAGYSSSKQVDKSGFALMASIFLPQLITEVQTSNVHIAATHQELADTLHGLVMREKIPVSFYYIYPGNSDIARINGTKCTTADENYGLYLPDFTQKYLEEQKPTRFLPYLPLIIGATYFYKSFTERQQVTLLQIHPNFLIVEDINGDHIQLLKEANNDVLYKVHKDEMLGERGLGKIYNYPIYPTFIMSIHMCQGRTITKNLNLMLSKTTFQGLYVAASRVRDPKQIHHVEIPNPLSYIISTIINVPEWSQTTNTITSQMLQRAFTNYQYINIPTTNTHMIELAIKFIQSQETAERQQIHDTILADTATFPREILNLDRTEAVEINNKTLEIMLEFKTLIAALSCLERIEYQHWLKLFKTCNLTIQQVEMCYDDYTLTPEEERNSLRSFTEISTLRNMNVEKSILENCQLSQKTSNIKYIIAPHALVGDKLVYHTTEFEHSLYGLIKTGVNEQDLIALLETYLCQQKPKRNMTKQPKKQRVSNVRNLYLTGLPPPNRLIRKFIKKVDK